MNVPCPIIGSISTEPIYLKFQGGGADNVESICELEGKMLC